MNRTGNKHHWSDLFLRFFSGPYLVYYSQKIGFVRRELVDGTFQVTVIR